MSAQRFAVGQRVRDARTEGLVVQDIHPFYVVDIAGNPHKRHARYLTPIAEPEPAPDPAMERPPITSDYVPDPAPGSEFDRLLREAVRTAVDAEEAYDRARAVKPDEVMWSQRFADALEAERMKRGIWPYTRAAREEREN